jgi:hypothetical protein
VAGAQWPVLDSPFTVRKQCRHIVGVGPVADHEDPVGDHAGPAVSQYGRVIVQGLDDGKNLGAPWVIPKGDDLLEGGGGPGCDQA